jgi:multimeric flavodoxin WrbA
MPEKRLEGNPMNVLLLNGSPRKDGNTATALHEMENIFHEEGIETELLQVGGQSIRGCVACGGCGTLGKCVFDDLVNEAAPKFEACDGLVVGSPVYYASANATLVAFLTRLFYSTHFDKSMKVGAAIAAARRGGTTTTFDELNKFFAISGMPIASGQYWNGIHGREKGEAAQDAEGLQMMRTLARNMSFLIKSIALGKEQYGLPQREPFQRTNFIR